jgi:hypothetical protein
MNGVSFTCIAAFAIGVLLGVIYLGKLIKEMEGNG